MTKTIRTAMTSKWLLVLQEYELVKRKKSSNFETVNQICDAFKVHRRDIRKYYERWASTYCWVTLKTSSMVVVPSRTLFAPS